MQISKIADKKQLMKAIKINWSFSVFQLLYRHYTFNLHNILNYLHLIDKKISFIEAYPRMHNIMTSIVSDSNLFFSQNVENEGIWTTAIFKESAYHHDELKLNTLSSVHYSQFMTYLPLTEIIIIYDFREVRQRQKSYFPRVKLKQKSEYSINCTVTSATSIPPPHPWCTHTYINRHFSRKIRHAH